MKERVGLHSSFEDIYENRFAFPDVYRRVSDLAQISEAPVQVESDSGVEEGRHTKPDRESFAALVASLRAKRRLLQQYVAKEVGVVPSTWSHWERGKRVPGKKGLILKIADALAAEPHERLQLLQSSGFEAPAPRSEVVEELQRFLIDPLIAVEIKAKVTDMVADVIQICRGVEGGPQNESEVLGGGN